MNLDHAMAYLDFVTERHRIWVQRQAGQLQPWTTEPTLARRKFTNVFRLLDPGSQYVLTDLLEPELAPEDLLLRLFLYRHTGRLEAWRHLLVDLGEYPTRANLDDVWKSWRLWRGEGVTRSKNTAPAHLRTNRAAGFQQTTYPNRVFMGAYTVSPFSTIRGSDKLECVVAATRAMFVTGTVAEQFLTAPDQPGRFKALRDALGVGDFMAQQVLTDWGYATEFREDEFIVAGPGARVGAAYVDPGRKAEQVIEWAYEALRGLPEAPTWAGRAPSRMDIQNTLCEYSKFVRFGRQPAPAGAKPYVPLHPGPQSEPLLPQHW